jgi:hypothetical protein
MTDIDAGDLVVAVPINQCSHGHPAWHRGLAHPEMDGKRYMVTWAGFSKSGNRPVIRVAGRNEHFCAGCFVKEKPSELTEQREVRLLEPVSMR